MPKISIKKRADLIQEGSSAYNYYINTPLSELSSRDDKLLKQELERRAMMALSESEEEEEEEDEEESSEDSKLSTATKVGIGAGAVAGGIGAGLASTYIVDHFNELVTKLKSYIPFSKDESISTSGSEVSSTTTDSEDVEAVDNSVEEEGSEATPDTSTVSSSWSFSGAMSNISDVFTRTSAWVNTKVQELMGKDVSDPSQTSVYSNAATGLIVGAVVIIGIYAIWKVFKWFIREDGEAKDSAEATSESKYISNQVEMELLDERYTPVTDLGNPFSKKFNPFYNNVAMAIIHESENVDTSEADKVINNANGSNGFMIKMAIKFSNNLINEDTKFVNCVNKNVPEFIVDIQKWKDEAENSGTEVTQESLMRRRYR